MAPAAIGFELGYSARMRRGATWASMKIACWPACQCTGFSELAGHGSTMTRTQAGKAVGELDRDRALLEVRALEPAGGPAPVIPIQPMKMMKPIVLPFASGRS